MEQKPFLFDAPQTKSEPLATPAPKQRVRFTTSPKMPAVVSAPIAEEDLGKCVTTPITNPDVLRVLRSARALPQLRFSPATASSVELSTARRRRLEDWVNRSWTPTDFYKCVFEMEPDPRVVKRVQKLLDAEKTGIAAGYRQNPSDLSELTGWIYVFRSLADPSDVVKIGRTIRQPEQRISEWASELGQDVVLLFAYPTTANMFAESIIHAVLTCWHESGRINALTGDALDEFFRVPNLMALKMFVRSVLRFVDRFSLYYRRMQPATQPFVRLKTEQ